MNLIHCDYLVSKIVALSHMKGSKRLTRLLFLRFFMIKVIFERNHKSRPHWDWKLLIMVTDARRQRPILILDYPWNVDSGGVSEWISLYKSGLQYFSCIKNESIFMIASKNWILEIPTIILKSLSIKDIKTEVTWCCTHTSEHGNGHRNEKNL